MSTVTTSTRTAAGPSVPLPLPSRIRVPQLAVGLLLTAGAALVFVLWNAASTAQVPVVVLAVDVERGHVVVPEDLQTVHVASQDAIEVTSAQDAATLVGLAAAVDLPAGTLVTQAQLTAGPTLAVGAGVVGLALGPGEYPTPYLAVGDVVEVLDVGGDAGPAVLVERAQVVWVEPLGSQGQRFVSVLTGAGAAAVVADVAAAGDVRLVLVADPGGDAGAGVEGGS